MYILVNIRGDNMVEVKSRNGGWGIPKPVSKVLVTSVRKRMLTQRTTLVGAP